MECLLLQSDSNPAVGRQYMPFEALRQDLPTGIMIRSAFGLTLTQAVAKGFFFPPSLIVGQRKEDSRNE